MRTSFPIRVTAACLLVTMTACMTWQPYSYELDRNRERPRELRVNLVTGESVQLGSPVLEGDTAIVGMERSGVLRRVPMRDVLSLQVREQAKARTALLLLGGLGLLVWAACADGVCIDLYGGQGA